MSRRRRYIKSCTCYEICFRARASLPLVAYRIMHLIIGAAISRTQRDDKVILCHDIWNGSHPHLVVVSRDSKQLVNFYSELQKKITDAIKRFLGLEHLQIWEGCPMVAEIGDLEAAKDRISYLYANPGQDNLEEIIDKFPGYSSWKDFLESQADLNAQTTKEYPWIRLPSIPRLRSRVISPSEDARLVCLMKQRNEKTHILVRRPNEWMKCFGVNSDDEARQINESIIALLREKEAIARKTRKVDRKRVMGSRALLSQPIMKEHKPKKRGRKVFIITTINKLRMQVIQAFNEFCARCKECYQCWKRGDMLVEWPPGAFKPPLPPNMNVLPT